MWNSVKFYIGIGKLFSSDSKLSHIFLKCKINLHDMLVRSDFSSGVVKSVTLNLSPGNYR